jgi:hypothetical protein
MAIDHQWDGKIVPTENVSIATHTLTGDTYLVTKVVRYNRKPPRLYNFTCHLLNQNNGKAGKGDVWYEGTEAGSSLLLLEDGVSFLLLEDGVSMLELGDSSTVEIWKCGDYVPVRFRDEDGVRKNM